MTKYILTEPHVPALLVILDWNIIRNNAKMYLDIVEYTVLYFVQLFKK